ncbi:MAG: hypothetical protein BWX71_00496 [Deltaproteobacteria bacterium ADurb.Bin072]|nr:MAG: hypothetical protein BWX71_00496 [Deltaproteobacteria bacterium ADurb.Bin072]
MAKKLMTRPRMSSSMMVWTMVLLATIWTMRPKPATAVRTRERGSDLEIPNRTIPAPNSMEATPMSRPRPRMLFLEARNRAPARAPTPELAMRKPRVSGPPLSTSLAKTGMRMA